MSPAGVVQPSCLPVNPEHLVSMTGRQDAKHDGRFSGGCLNCLPLPITLPKNSLLGTPSEDWVQDPDCTEWKKRPRKHVKRDHPLPSSQSPQEA